MIYFFQGMLGHDYACQISLNLSRVLLLKMLFNTKGDLVDTATTNRHGFQGSFMLILM